MTALLCWKTTQGYCNKNSNTTGLRISLTYHCTIRVPWMTTKDVQQSNKMASQTIIPCVQAMWHLTIKSQSTHWQGHLQTHICTGHQTSAYMGSSLKTIRAHWALSHINWWPGITAIAPDNVHWSVVAGGVVIASIVPTCVVAQQWGGHFCTCNMMDSQ